MMRLVVVNSVYADRVDSPEQLLDLYRNLIWWADAVAGAVDNDGFEKVDVDVVQRFHCDAAIERASVRCSFVSDGLGMELPWWRASRATTDCIVEACADATRHGDQCAVHLHGLGQAAMLRSMRRRLPVDVPIVVQHHAERPRSGLPGVHQRWALARADGYLFAARGIADEWIRRRRICRQARVFEIMEGSTEFSRADRKSARRGSGLRGAPVFLWVGRLDENKDPLTVLDAFEVILSELPDARVYMAHGEDSPLRSAVEVRISGSEVLRGAVRLLGTVPHERMEQLYNSADYFLLGSRYEGSGFALAEALACGVVPVVTDIPSFRMMTDGGAFGGLWSPGRSEELVSAIRTVLDRPIEEASAAAREFFDRRLSYFAIGRQAVAIYREVLDRRYGAR